MAPPDADRRIFFVNRFYAPDQSATAQILTDVAEGLALLGWDVNIITSHINYSNSAQNYPRFERLNKINIYRVWTSQFGRHNIVGRTIDYLTFYLSCFIAVSLKISSKDIVIVKTDPPLLAVFLEPVLRFKKAIKVNWLQDIYPEIAEKLDVKLAKGAIGHILKRLRTKTLTRAEQNITISEQMSKIVARLGVMPTAITRIDNFTDDQAIKAIPNNNNALRSDWGYKPSDIVVGYSGNFGRAHDTMTVLGAMQALRENARVKFLFIGAGDGFDRLKAEVVSAGLQNVLFKPYQDREDLPLSLTVPDIHWLSLKATLEGFLLPSKIYGIMAAGRPVIFVGASNGDLAQLIQDADMGYQVNIGDYEGFVSAINKLAESEILYREKAKNSRLYLDENYTRKHILKKWDQMLKNLI